MICEVGQFGQATTTVPQFAGPSSMAAAIESVTFGRTAGVLIAKAEGAVYPVDENVMTAFGWLRDLPPELQQAGVDFISGLWEVHQAFAAPIPVLNQPSTFLVSTAAAEVLAPPSLDDE